MVAPKRLGYTFRRVHAARADRVFLTVGHDESDEKHLKLSFVFRWAGSWTSKGVPYNLTGVTAVLDPSPHILLMDINGDIIRWHTDPIPEKVDPGPDGPQHVGDLMDIRTIGQHAYVVGMGRMAYRCDAPGTWARIDRSVRSEDGGKNSVGFTAVHGFDEREIYAAGWEGEIWQYDGNAWVRREVPTKLAFLALLCAPDGHVYAAGQLGTIFFGRGDRWTLVKQSVTKEDIHGAAWFKGNAYFSTSSGIFILRKGVLEKLDVKPKGRAKLKFGLNQSFGRLSSCDEVMWSAGSKMLLYTDDGKTWSEPPYW